MSAHAISVLQSQIESLRRKVSEETEAKAAADAESQQRLVNIQRLSNKVEALEEAIAAVQGPQSTAIQKTDGRGVRESQNGHDKLKPTAAIMAMIDANGSATRNELLALAHSIDSDTDKPRHLMQTTLYLLTKRGKIINQNNVFRRAKASEKE